MSLDIIGAGFGRTGTLSLKMALERLGYTKTYHMMEVFGHPEHLEQWESATRGGQADWDLVFDGYRAAVDWPASAFWRPLIEHYPDSRVILSVRDPDQWFDSVHKTIYPTSRQAQRSDDAFTQRWASWAFELIWDGVFSGKVEDREHAKAVYQANVQEVMACVSPDRLLVFQAAEGWQPLCQFLGCPVPDEPYPRVNTSEDFLKR